MLQRIRKMTAVPDFCLDVTFDDGKHVIYGVKEDIRTLPGYRALEDVFGLFQQARLDSSRTCVFWTDEIDLPSDAIYEYGRDCDRT